MSQGSQTTATNAAAGELRTAAATARQIAAEREAAHNTSQEPATDAAHRAIPESGQNTIPCTPAN